MVSIKIKIEVEQKNPEEVLRFKDEDASLLEMNGYERIIYQESKDVLVVLDITKHQVSLKRQGEWLTQGLFSPLDDSFILIKNDLGTIKFELKIQSYNHEEDSLFIKYHLLEDGKTKSKHEYKCTWTRRD